MQSRKTLAGLDIGSHKICCAVGDSGSDGKLAILGMAEVRSAGVKNGVISDVSLAAPRISEAIKRVQEKTSTKIGTLYVSVSGKHIKGINSRGAVSLVDMESEITEFEIERVIELAKSVNIPSDQERLHVFPQVYSIDNRYGILDPIGLSGDRLEAEVHIVTASMSAAKGILDAVKPSGANVEDFVFSPIASCDVLLTGEEKQQGALLIDVGAATTDFALFGQNTVWQTQSIPLGGRNVTADIAYGLKLPADEAEQIKICQGSALISQVDPKEKLSLPDLGEFYQRRISRSVLAAIIEPRMEEILVLVKKQVERSPVADRLLNNVVLTGGGSCLRDLEKLASRVFGVEARLAKPVVGDDELVIGNLYGGSVSAGLVNYAYSQISPDDERKGLLGRVSDRFEKVVNAILSI